MSHPYTTCVRWAVDLSTWAKPTLTQLSQAVAAIQTDERSRLMKFHFFEDFQASLVGRLLMRKFVSTCTTLPFHAVQFARDLRGKPYWAKPDNDVGATAPVFSFNVSHQGGLVLLAGVFAESGDASFREGELGVGVDVMKIEYGGGKPLSEFFRLMQKNFSATEWRYITRPQHTTDRAKLKAFMRSWCLKEAYVKELGVGITIDLQSISFSLDPTVELCSGSHPLRSTTLRCADKPMTQWCFEEHLLQEEYCAAIAFKNCAPSPENFILLPIDNLLRPSDEAESEEILSYCRAALAKQRKT